MIELIIALINNVLRQSNLFTDVLGLCERIEDTENGATITYPAAYNQNGEYEHINFERSVVYHRKNGDTQYSQSPDNSISGCEDLVTVTVPLITVGYTNKDNFECDNAFTSEKAAENVAKLIKITNFKSLLSALDAETTLVEIKGYSTNKYSVWDKEYSGVAFSIENDRILFSVEYNIIITASENCLKSWDCNSSIEITPTQIIVNGKTWSTLEGIPECLMQENLCDKPFWNIIEENITHWNTAYIWGNHADAGYLTSYTETDPTIPSHVKNISTGDIDNWDAAYGWGNHASAGYLTSYTETDPTVPSHIKSITTTEKSNWNTAFSWGNHASVGYLTSYNETDPTVPSYVKNYPSLTTGSIPYGVSGGYFGQDNTSLFWDATNKRIGIGTNTPPSKISLAAGTTAAEGIDFGSLVQFYKRSGSNFQIDAPGGGILFNTGTGISNTRYSNTSTSSNGLFQLLNSGTTLIRDQPDANPTLNVKNNNVSSTGDIFQAANNAANVFTISQAGAVSCLAAQPFLLPKLTTTQRNALSGIVAGHTIFNTTTNKTQTYDGTSWQDHW